MMRCAKLAIQAASLLWGLATIPQAQGAQAMMTLNVSIELENSAFDFDRNGEVAAILQKFVARLLRTSTPLDTQYTHTLLDVNGNTVGRVVVENKRT